MSAIAPETPRRMSGVHMLTLVVGVLLGAGGPVVLAYDWPPLIVVGLVIAGIAPIIAGAARGSSPGY